LQLRIGNMEINLEFLESHSFVFSSFFIYHLFFFKYFLTLQKSMFLCFSCQLFLMALFFLQIFRILNLNRPFFKKNEKLIRTGFHKNRLVYHRFWHRRFGRRGHGTLLSVFSNQLSPPRLAVTPTCWYTLSTSHTRGSSVLDSLCSAASVVCP
jgi:hypothetical protein